MQWVGAASSVSSSEIRSPSTSQLEKLSAKEVGNALAERVPAVLAAGTRQKCVESCIGGRLLIQHASSGSIDGLLDKLDIHKRLHRRKAGVALKALFDEAGVSIQWLREAPPRAAAEMQGITLLGEDGTEDDSAADEEKAGDECGSQEEKLARHVKKWPSIKLRREPESEWLNILRLWE